MNSLYSTKVDKADGTLKGRVIMGYRVMLLLVCGLLAACGTIVTPTPLASTSDSYLVALVRRMIPPIPQGNWCDKNADFASIDTYNAALIAALSQLLADPASSTRSTDKLAEIFVAGAQINPSHTFILNAGGDTLLAVLPTYRASCLESFHYRSIISRIVLFNPNGEFWPIRQVVTNTEAGTVILRPGAVQWAGDRWVVTLNDLGKALCPRCFEVVQIVRQGGDWIAVTALEGKGQDFVLVDPALRLINGYQMIGVTLTSYDDPPCILDAETQARLAWTIYITEHIYQWDNTRYVLLSDHILDTRVILYAGNTYERLLDWEAHCAA